MVGERTETGIRNSADLIHITKELDRLEQRIRRLEAMLWKVALGSAGSTVPIVVIIQLVHNST